MTRARVVTSGCVAVALALTGCSRGGDDQPGAIGGDTTPAATDDVVETPEPEPEPEVTPEDEIAEVWVAFHEQWLEHAGGTVDISAADYEGLAADPEATAGGVSNYVENEPGLFVTLEAEHWPEVEIDGDRATIEDCVIALQHPDTQDAEEAEPFSALYRATAVKDGDDWLIEGRSDTGVFNCVPAELNEQLLQAYRDYRDALNDAWDPPDPDHPALEQTMVNPRLDFIRDLITEHREEGIVVRTPTPTDHAVVYELGIGEAIVSDCTEQVPEYGAYDLETGERRDDLIPPIKDGQIDLQSVDLVRTDDGWKVEEQGAAVDSNCLVGDTPYVVQ